MSVAYEFKSRIMRLSSALTQLLLRLKQSPLRALPGQIWAPRATPDTGGQLEQAGWRARRAPRPRALIALCASRRANFETASQKTDVASDDHSAPALSHQRLTPLCALRHGTSRLQVPLKGHGGPRKQKGRRQEGFWEGRCSSRCAGLREGEGGESSKGSSQGAGQEEIERGANSRGADRMQKDAGLWARGA